MLAAHLLPIENAVSVTVKINVATATKFSFPNDENLKGKKIVAIEAFQQSTVAKTAMGQPVLNDAAFMEAFLTIQSGGKEKIRELPLSAICAQFNNGLVKFFNDIEPDMQKSYVSFSDTANLVKDEEVLLVFYFK